MRVENFNPYSRLIGQPQKAKEEPKLLKVKKIPIDEKAMEKRMIELEEIKKLEERMKSELAKMKQAEESIKSEKDGMKVLRVCLEISRRIMRGDEVPQKDHKYLMEHDMDLYARAITFRRYKEDPRKYKQLSEDEEPRTPLGIMNFGSPGSTESSATVSQVDVSV